MENLYPNAYEKSLKLATIVRYGMNERGQLPPQEFNDILDSWVNRIVRDRQAAHEKVVAFMKSDPSVLLSSALQFLKDNPDTGILSFSSVAKRVFVTQGDYVPELVNLMVEFSRVAAVIFDKSVEIVQLDLVDYGKHFETCLYEATLDVPPPPIAPSTDTRH